MSVETMEAILPTFCQVIVIILAIAIQLHPRIRTGSLASLVLGAIAIAALVRLGQPADEIEFTAWGVVLVVLLDILLHCLVPPIDWTTLPTPQPHDKERTAP